MNSEILRSFHTSLGLFGGIFIALAIGAFAVGHLIARVRERRYLRLL